MMDIRVITAIGLGVVAVGVGAITLLPNRQETESKLLTAAQISEQAMQGNTAQTEPENSFQSIAIPPDVTPICSLPKPPRNIGDSALTRNSLRQIMRLIALQKWEKTGSCECYYSRITWEDVTTAAPNFERADGVELRFDLSGLRAQADELERQRTEVCSE